MEYQPSLYKSPAGQQVVMNLYDRALAEWPVPFESHEIETRHGRTFVIRCGPKDGPPLVLLHGAGTNSAIWIGDVATYTQAYRVYAIDLLGEAGRSAPDRLPWDSPAYAEWLADVLDGLRFDCVSLVGVSLGGWTGLKYATAKPDGVEQLVLISPGGIVPNRLSFVFKAIPMALMGEWGQRRLLRLLYGDQPVPDGAAEVTAVVSRHFKSRIGALPVLSDEELAELKMPVLLVGGVQDALLDMPGTAARLERILPDITVRIRPKAGHAVLNTAEEVMTFLRQLHVPAVA